MSGRGLEIETLLRYPETGGEVHGDQAPVLKEFQESAAENGVLLPD